MKSNTQLQCNKCEFVGTSRENLSEHIRNEDCQLISCQLCDYTSKSQMEMNTHEKDVHKVTKYHCDLCDNYFTKFEKLEEYKTKKHNIGQVPCNEYNYKALNLSMIDDLIA